jgi:hypothetical protein
MTGSLPWCFIIEVARQGGKMILLHANQKQTAFD